MVLALSACSTDNAKEKSSIEQATDKVAEEAAESIKTALEKSKMVKELSEDHNQKVKEAIE